MTLQEFEKLVGEIGLAALPVKFQDKVKNVAFLVEDDVTPELRKLSGIRPNETLLGFYHGIPQLRRGESYGIGMTLPDKIYLFRRPIVELAEETGKPVHEVISETIWHEVAHHFGMEEHEVRDRERHKHARGA